VLNELPMSAAEAMPPFDPSQGSGSVPLSEVRVTFPGPFVRHEVVVDGWAVPLLHAHPSGSHDEDVTLVIDDRIALTVSVDEAERFVPFLADAIAVALGYTSHPEKHAEQPLQRQPHPRLARMHAVASEIG
jgi:hypothetical protein